MKFIDYKEGEKIGKCFFISNEPSRVVCKKPLRYARFKCFCGKEFTSSIKNVKSNGISCGCQKRKARIHGHAASVGRKSEYNTWQNMKKRCFRKSNAQFKDYGGRGISVCDRWLNSFENFFSDMGLKPTPTHSIERIDNNGNYEPSNCRWATKQDQSRNTRRNVIIEYNGIKMTRTDWAKKFGLNTHILRKRIECGWSIEDALTKPVIKNNY